MRVKVLGSAAGGGFPQWNCACGNCQRLREGKLRGRARSQTQLAFTTDNQAWFLLSASPDLRAQMLATAELCPKPSRGRQPSASASPIAGVFLPSADVDSVAGLLHLREFHPLFIFATDSVQQVLRRDNKIFRVLERSEPPAKWVTLSGKSRLGCHLDHDAGSVPEFLCITAPIGDSYPDYVSDELRRTLPPEDATCALVIQKGEKRLFYAPSIPAASATQPWTTASWKSYMENSHVAFIDATFWSDDELIQTGRSKKTAREIGHLPLSGLDGLLEQYPKTKGRRILIHINNTNPILDEESHEHHAALDAGFEIAYDGMELEI